MKISEAAGKYFVCDDDYDVSVRDNKVFDTEDEAKQYGLSLVDPEDDTVFNIYRVSLKPIDLSYMVDYLVDSNQLGDAYFETVYNANDDIPEDYFDTFEADGSMIGDSDMSLFKKSVELALSVMLDRSGIRCLATYELVREVEVKYYDDPDVDDEISTEVVSDVGVLPGGDSRFKPVRRGSI